MFTVMHLPTLPIHTGEDWVVVSADCMESDKVNASEGTVDLFFADPPYNYGFDYGPGINDKRSAAGYLEWCCKWLAIAHSRLRPNGAMWLMFPDEWVAEISVFCERAGGLNMERRNWIIWNETFGTNQNHKFSRCKRHLLYYIKRLGNTLPRDALYPTFNAGDVRIPSDRQLKYKDKRANPKGKVPGDVWQFSRVAGTFKERDGRVPTQIPEALLYRIVQACTGVGDRILEFFTGSGSLGRVVMRAGHGRSYEGWELDAATAEIAAERIAEAAASLRGKPPVDTSPEERGTGREAPESGESDEPGR